MLKMRVLRVRARQAACCVRKTPTAPSAATQRCQKKTEKIPFSLVPYILFVLFLALIRFVVLSVFTPFLKSC